MPSVPKHSLDSQEDTLEPKRRRTAGKRTRLPGSDMETSQPTSVSSAPLDEESELVILKKRLQTVQEDYSALQQDQRQPNIPRGLQPDKNEVQPRDTLRFLEEHFTCAL